MADVDVRITDVIGPAYYSAWRELRGNKWREYWADGGRGSLKSSFVSIFIICGIVADPDANAIAYRKVGDTLRDTVFTQLVWAINILRLESYFSWHVSPMEITYVKTGQRILFRGADKPEKSKSVKLARGAFKFLWFEELTDFAGMEDVRTIKASVLRGSDMPTLTLYTYNPPVSANAWVNAEALREVPGRLRHHTDYRSAPKAWLGASFLAEAEALKMVNERAYRHMYLGEVTGTGGAIFGNLVFRTITDDEIKGFDRPANGLDFGFAGDPDALIRLHYSKRFDTVHLFGEHCALGNSVAKLGATIKTMCGRELITADSEDPRMIAELKQCGVNVIAAHKGPGSIDHGLRWLQDRASIVIDPRRCPNAAREFGGYEYPVDRNGNFIAAYPDKNNHTIDAARYACERLRMPSLGFVK